MSQSSSRLQALQVRFQQKQMQEKEQKMLQIYDQQQQRAYQVIQRGSAGSTGSVSQVQTVMRTTTTTHTPGHSQGGRVRQMFDERRQTTVKGIDKSYPLEPLDDKPMRQVIKSNEQVLSKEHPNKDGVRQTVTVRRVVRSDINSNLDRERQTIFYPRELRQVSFGKDNQNGDHHNLGYDLPPTHNGVHIEEIVIDDTIERNRMLAKIHLMKYGENLRDRVNNDLNSEIFPDDFMVDVPEKLPGKRMTKKLSAAEARLEKFKNAKNKRSNTVGTKPVNRSELMKRSGPMSPSPKTISRGSPTNSNPTEVVEVRRSAIERSPSPAAKTSPRTNSRKLSSPGNTKAVKLQSPGLASESTIPTKTVTQVDREKSADDEPELARTVQSVIEIPDSSSKVQRRPGFDAVGRKPANLTAGTPTKRIFLASPTNTGDVVTKRPSTRSKKREPVPMGKSTPKNHEAIGTTHTKPVETKLDGKDDDTMCGTESQLAADTRKSLTPSPIPKKNKVKSTVTNTDGNSNKKTHETVTRATPTKFHTERPPTPRTPKSSSTTRSPSPRPPSALSSGSSTTIPARRTSSVKSPVRHMDSDRKNSTRSPGLMSSPNGLSSVKNGPTVLSSDTLVACKICGRRFAQDRVSLHEKICAKTGQKKRKQFDTMLHRVQGTELEAFAKKGPTGKQAERRSVKKPVVETKSNWRRKHEDFINAIRSAKQVQAHLAAGGKLSDLPPPPASDTSDYTQCPHCGRKFNQSAAERHIPKCATMMHNKPNPRAPPKSKR